MDFADKLDMMDDDCDIEGFPDENILKEKKMIKIISPLFVDLPRKTKKDKRIYLNLTNNFNSLYLKHNYLTVRSKTLFYIVYLTVSYTLQGFAF